MTIAQKRKILIRIQACEKDIATLQEVQKKLASSEYVSASMSSGGGSKSYTRSDINRVRETIASLQQEVSHLRSFLFGNSSATPNQIYITWN